MSDEAFRTVAIIPARGGSKRIRRKNIRPFLGKPIIQWVLEAAKRSGCFDAIVVSTDDAEIAALSSSFGAEVPFFRPTELADDFTPTVAVMSHAIKALEEVGRPYHFACCIYPTGVFASSETLERGLNVLLGSDCLYVMSATRFSHPIERALRIDDQQRVSMNQPVHAETRSQDLPPAFHDAGQFYWGRSEAWRAESPILSGRTRAVVLSNSEAHDIDEESDWRIAEQIFARQMH